MSKILLFNPVSIVHARNLSIFKNSMPDWNLRCIYNRKLPWFSDIEKDSGDEIAYFTGGYFPAPPRGLFDNVSALVLFTSQPRLAPCSLIQEAALRKIPVIAVEEVYQMILQQGLLNNYLLPVDRLFVASEYEKGRFIELGVSAEIIEVTGYMFGHKGKRKLNSPQKLKSDFNLSVDKLTLTLCLDSLTSEFGALEVCKRLISCASQNLPNRCELLIKPHPEDQKSDFVELVRKYSPEAKIADPKISIDEVLDVTDVLLNRGNSQVVIDALERKIPVIAVPLGRKTFFHGCLDEVIVSDNNLINVLSLVERSGFALYNEIIRKYLTVSSEEAVKKITFRISEIADKNELYNPQGRLIELSLFWTWMGFAPQGMRTLSKVKNIYTNKDLLERVYKLLCCKADRKDLSVLKECVGSGYKKWILQSLWIKGLYLNKKKLEQGDGEWLKDFPPSMERSRFLDYAILLYWCYINSEMRKESEVLIDNLYKEFGSIKMIQKLKSLKLIEKGKAIFNIQYSFSRIKYNAILALRNHILNKLPF